MKKSRISQQLDTVRKELNSQNGGELASNLFKGVEGGDVEACRVVSEDGAHYLLVKGMKQAEAAKARFRSTISALGTDDYKNGLKDGKHIENTGEFSVFGETPSCRINDVFATRIPDIIRNLRQEETKVIDFLELPLPSGMDLSTDDDEISLSDVEIVGEEIKRKMPNCDYHNDAKKQKTINMKLDERPKDEGLPVDQVELLKTSNYPNDDFHLINNSSFKNLTDVNSSLKKSINVKLCAEVNEETGEQSDSETSDGWYYKNFSFSRF